MSAGAVAGEQARAPARVLDERYLASLLERAGCTRNASGRLVCRECKVQPVTGTEATCPSCVSKAIEARDRQERDLASGRRKARVVDLGRRAFAAPPDWPHLQSRDEFRSRVTDQTLRSFAERFDLRRSVLILGLSGAGKTSSVARNVKMVAKQRTGACLRDPSDHAAHSALEELSGLVWCTASELGRAPGAHRLGTGDEPPLVKAAAQASILVLDEVGQESARYRPHIFEVIDRRYVAQRPTICTSGLTAVEFREQYGDAVWRRLTEKGIGSLVDVHPKPSGGAGG